MHYTFGHEIIKNINTNGEQINSFLIEMNISPLNFTGLNAYRETYNLKDVNEWVEHINFYDEELNNLLDISGSSLENIPYGYNNNHTINLTNFFSNLNINVHRLICKIKLKPFNEIYIPNQFQGVLSCMPHIHFNFCLNSLYIIQQQIRDININITGNIDFFKNYPLVENKKSLISGECSICMEDKENLITFGCGHSTCEECYIKLFKSNNKCCLCRKKICSINRTRQELININNILLSK